MAKSMLIIAMVAVLVAEIAGRRAHVDRAEALRDDLRLGRRSEFYAKVLGASQSDEEPSNLEMEMNPKWRWIIDNARGKSPAEDTHNAEISETDEKAKRIGDARNIVHQSDKSMKDARQILEDFNNALSQGDSDYLLTKAENAMTQQIVDNAGGTLSEPDARNIVRKGLESMTHDDAQQIIDRAEETMSAGDAQQVVNSEKLALGEHTKLEPKSTRQQLVQRILSNYKDSLSKEDSKHLLKVAEGSITEQILQNNEGKLTENGAQQIIHDAEIGMTDDEAEQIISNVASTMSVDDAYNLVNNAKHLVHDLEQATNHDRVSETQEIIENFNKALSKEDAARLLDEAEAKMTQQIVENSNGALSESDARKLVRDGIKSMSDRDADQIIKRAEETMSVDDAQQFVDMEKAMLSDGESKLRPSEQQDAQLIIEGFKNDLSKVPKEDLERLLEEAEAKMTQRIVENSNGAMNEADARKLIRDGIKSMSDRDADQIIKRAEETMSVDYAQQFVNMEKAMLSDGESKVRPSDQEDAQSIIEGFKNDLSKVPKEDLERLLEEAEAKMTQRIVENSNGAMNEVDAHKLVRDGIKSMSDRDVDQIINRAEETMSGADAQQFVNAELEILIAPSANKKFQEDGEHLLVEAEAKVTQQISSEQQLAHSDKQHVQQIIEGFDKKLSKEDTQRLQAEAEATLTQEIVDNSNGDLSESEARKIVRDGIESMTDKDARQILESVEETMSVDDAQQFVKDEKAVLSDDKSKRGVSDQQNGRLIIEEFKKDLSKLSKEDTEHLLAEAEAKMTQQIVDNSNGAMSESAARNIVRDGINSMTDGDARKIINSAEETTSVDDAQQFVDAEKTLLKSDSHTTRSSESFEKESLGGKDASHKEVGAERANIDARQIIEGFDQALSKEDAQDLLAEAEAKMVQQVVENSKGTLSASEAQDIVNKGEKIMTEEDAVQIIKRAEESMSVDDARRFVNAEKEAILDKQMERSLKAATAAEKIPSGQQHGISETGNNKITPADSKTQGIVGKVEKTIADGAKRFGKVEKNIVDGARRLMHSESQRIGKVEKNIIDGAQRLMHSEVQQLGKAEKNILDGAQRMMHQAKRVMGMDGTRHTSKLESSLQQDEAEAENMVLGQQVFNNDVGIVREHHAHDLSRNVKKYMAAKHPSHIINRASDMMKVADFKITNPTSPGLTGLGSPFEFD